MERELIATSNGVRSYDGRDSQSLRARLSTTELVHLIALMKEHGELQEITIEHQATGLKLTLRKPAPVVLPVPPHTGVVVGEAEEVAEGLEALGGEHGEEESEGPHRAVTVCAPLVGIYRTSAKGDEAPLLEPGDTVRHGQIIGAIESLNVLNEVEAAASGTVREVAVHPGQRVEYGQTLFVIEPMA